MEVASPAAAAPHLAGGSLVAVAALLSITNDLDDLTPSSDSTTDDIESFSSIHKETIVLKEELSLDCNEENNLKKVNLPPSTSDAGFTKTPQELLNLVNAVRQMVEEERNETQRQLCQNARAIQEDILNNQFWRQKELEEESKKVATKHSEVAEEHNETQRQLCQEQNARAIQEDILNTQFWRQKELDEESKKVATKHSESTIRQLQQELADSLQKQSTTEASLEFSTRYRIDLEADKQQLLKEIERMKCKLQDSELQNSHCKRSTRELQHALHIKECEASVASQKLQDLLVASSGINNAIKQLEEHIQRLEIENARLEATTNRQNSRIEILQKDLQDSVSVHNRLEELITTLQTAQTNLEEKLNQELENEKKKVKNVLELKRSVEMRLDQEMKRNSELQKEYHGIKKLQKITKKKLKEYETGESSSQISFTGEIKNKYSEIDNEVGKLRKRVDELSHHLEVKSTRSTQLEATNCELCEQLASMKIFHQNHEQIEKSKFQLEEEVANLKRQIEGNLRDLSQVEKYRREIEERSKQEIKQKIEEINFFLQTQAASQETLEQIRAASNAHLRNQLENRIKELESELAKFKNSHQDSILQKESTLTELERYKGLHSEEVKIRKSFESKLDRANAKLAEANTELNHERHKNKSLLANSLIRGNLSSSLVLETIQMGNLGNNLAKSLNLGGGFINTNGSGLASKNRMEAYLAKQIPHIYPILPLDVDQIQMDLQS
ncbi:ankyrin repeat domain-containing protein 26-like [Erythrolamprus reginae]|uniref:ankyrin repeat domain-containing protein 26-like n=1 Tax=Erythrolamprus reginae TaxID=121349 RepID=UPI00396C94FB